jgi:hypothetical protein
VEASQKFTTSYPHCAESAGRAAVYTGNLLKMQNENAVLMFQCDEYGCGSFAQKSARFNKNDWQFANTCYLK